MNALDAVAYAEDSGTEDGVSGVLRAPFSAEFDKQLFEVYMSAWWRGFAQRAVDKEFPNDEA